MAEISSNVTSRYANRVGERRNPWDLMSSEVTAIHKLLETCDEQLAEVGGRISDTLATYVETNTRKIAAVKGRQDGEKELDLAGRLRETLEEILLDIESTGTKTQIIPIARGGQSEGQTEPTACPTASDGPDAIQDTLTELIKWIRVVNTAIEGWDLEIPTMNALIKATEQKLDSLLSHKDRLSRLKIHYRRLLHPIWTVPDDVWLEIFSHCTDTNAKTPGLNSDWINDPRKRYEALRITWICKHWRILAHDSPRLWSNMNLSYPRRPSSLGAVLEHYNTLSKKAPRNLLVVGGCSLSNALRSRLAVILKSAPIRLVAVWIVMDRTDDWMLNTLRIIPSCSNFWVLQKRSAGIYPSFHRIVIPAQLCSTLEHLYTQLVKIELEDRSNVRLKTYKLEPSLPPSVLPWKWGSMWPIHVFAPSSVSTLTEVNLGHSPPIRSDLQSTEMVVFPQLKTLRICLAGLIRHFGNTSSAPHLHALEILEGRFVSAEEYQHMNVGTRFESLESLTIIDTGKPDATSLLIMDLGELRTLTLLGKDSMQILHRVTQALPQSAHGLQELAIVEISSNIKITDITSLFIETWKERNHELRAPGSLALHCLYPDGTYSSILSRAGPPHNQQASPPNQQVSPHNQQVSTRLSMNLGTILCVALLYALLNR